MIIIKILIMKKLFLFSAIAFSLVACKSKTESTTTSLGTVSDTVSSINNNDTVGTSPNDSRETASPGYTYPETYNDFENGDLMLKDGKMVVYDNGNWVRANQVKLDNGVLVMVNGRVTKDKNEYNLKEGEIVKKSGNVLDRTGHSMDNAWDKTKDAANKAGTEVKDAANKAGSEVKDAANKVGSEIKKGVDKVKDR